MGGSTSSVAPIITFEEAKGRLGSSAKTEELLGRWKAAYDKVAAPVIKINKKNVKSGASKKVQVDENAPRFMQNLSVMLPGVPDVVRQAFFSRCFDVSGKGLMDWKATLVALVLLTRGTLEEKGQCLLRIYDADGDGQCSRLDVESICGPDCPPGANAKAMVDAAFSGDIEFLTPAQLLAWLRGPAAETGLSKWLLMNDNNDPNHEDNVNALADKLEASKNLTLSSSRVIDRDATSAYAAVLSALTNQKTYTAERVAQLLQLEVDDPVIQYVVQRAQDDAGDISSRSLASVISNCCSGKGCWAMLDRDKSGTVAECLVSVGARLCIDAQYDPSKMPIADKSSFLAAYESKTEDDVPGIAKRALHVWLGVKPETVPQMRRILAEVEEEVELVVGRKRYLVAKSWYDALDNLVNNESLLLEGSSDQLAPNLVEDSDYVTVCARSWFILMHWFGGGPEFARPVVKIGDGDNGRLVVEAYKVPLHVFVCDKVKSGVQKRKKKKGAQQEEGELPVAVSETLNVKVSAGEPLSGLKRALCRKVRVQDYFARLWKVVEGNKLMLLDIPGLNVQSAGLKPDDQLVIECAFVNGTWPTDSTDPTMLLTMGGGDAAIEWVPGLLGFNNLGNTCYMNSALQCLTASPSFATYFASGLYRKEVNLMNPIGHKGLVAAAMGRFLNQVWSLSPPDNALPSGRYCIAPRDLKNTLGDANEQFKGRDQQDAQELLAWLLDALHEDVNRILEKPYSQNPEGMPDEQLAAAFWEQHKSRNDSVVVDLFHGQLKSTLRCPECDHKSVNFDTFASLTLPLPTEEFRLLEFRLYANPDEPPVRYGCRVPKNARISDFQAKVAELWADSDVAASRLVVLRTGRGRVEKLFSPLDRIEAVRDQEVLTVVPVIATGSRLALAAPRLFAGQRAAHRVAPPKDASEDEPRNCLSIFRKNTIKVKPTKENPKPVESQKAEEKDPAVEVQVEGEEKIPSPLQKASKVSADVVFVTAMHRRLEPLSEGFLVEHKSQLMATPLFLSLKLADYNTESLYRMVWDRSARIIRGADDEEQAPPFVLRIVNPMGTACGVCSWSSFCSGCPLDDSLIHADVHLRLAIDWYLPVLKRRFDQSAADAESIHDSVEAERKNQDFPIDISECLSLFSEEEELDDWYCSQCKDFRKGKKKLEIWKLPPLLVVHFKRFQLNRQRWSKTNKLVNFPVHDMDPIALAGGEPGATQFELYAALNHFGGLGGGHYTAYINHHPTDNWYYMDDSSYRQVESGEMTRTRAAYVLFYKSKDLTEDKMQEILGKVNVDAPDVEPAQQEKWYSKCSLF